MLHSGQAPLLGDAVDLQEELLQSLVQLVGSHHARDELVVDNVGHDDCRAGNRINYGSRCGGRVSQELWKEGRACCWLGPRGGCWPGSACVRYSTSIRGAICVAVLNCISLEMRHVCDHLHLAKLCVDPGEKLVAAERLTDIVDAAGREALQDILWVAFGGYHDDGYRGRWVLLPQLVAHLVAAHARHHDIEQNHVGQVAAILEQLQCAHAVEARRHLVVGSLENSLNDEVVERSVINTQNFGLPVQLPV
mmetsp:Transcript_39530/g.95410  ORF Transcript_39530/g.95410 Transcript_39530/m.95410 type:complete len:250 (+) Transcript_39530:2301-3050(+)